MQFSATISLGGWRHAADGAPREGRGAAARQPAVRAALLRAVGECECGAAVAELP